MKGRLRSLWVGCLAITLVAATLAIAAALGRRTVAEQLLLRAFEVAEIAVESLSVESVALDRIVVRDIRASEGIDLRVGRVEAAFDGSSLRAAQLTSLDVSDVVLRLSVAGEGETGTSAKSAGPPGFGAPLADRKGEATSVPLDALSRFLASPLLPTRQLDLSGLRVELDTGETRFEVRGALHSAQSEEHLEAVAELALQGPAALAPGVLSSVTSPFELRVDARSQELQATLSPASLQIEIRNEEEPLPIAVVTPQIDLRLTETGAGQPPRLEIASSGGHIRASGLEARGIEVTMDFAVDELPQTIGLEIGQLLDLQRPARIPSLSMAAELQPAERPIPFSLAATRRGAEQSVSVRGHHDSARESGRAEFHLKPLEFAEGGLQPADLVPALAEMVSRVGGSVEALGSVSWAFSDPAPAQLHTRVELALQNIGLTTPFARIEGVHTLLELDGPWPPSTPPEQRIQIGLIDVGFALSDAMASFQLHPDLSLTLEDAVLHFAGGTLRTRGVLDLTAEEQALTLDVAALDLGALFELVDLEGLSGNGTVSGRIPIARKRDAIEIRDGHLSNRITDLPAGSGSQAGNDAAEENDAARKGGWIRYRPDSGVEAAASDQSALDQALEALRNFHYEELDVTLSGDTKGIVQLALHLAGANPDYFDGWPVEFNLNLESHLVDLLRQESAAVHLADEIESRISDFASRASNFSAAKASRGEENEVAAPQSGR